MSDPDSEMGPDEEQMPVEVQLVSEVKSARNSQWFWGEMKPYGAYPSFDFKSEYPPEVVENYKIEPEQVKWLEANVTGYNYIDPAVASGCRKAPVMTVGINPNVTAFQPGVRGTTWCYPAFKKDSSYAYYYRYRTIYQESLGLDLVAKNLVPGTELKAEADGWITGIERSNTRRWMLLTLQYADRECETTLEITWATGERFVMLFDRDYDYDPKKTGAKPQLKKDATLGGKLNVPENASAEVYHNVTGYYERFISVLDRFAKLLPPELAAKANLKMGEDVLQDDMVASASPGWSAKYDMPRDRIAYDSVLVDGFVVAQILQSMPKVIVLVSSSALTMFELPFGSYMTLETKDKSTFQLMRETTEGRHYLEINIDGYHYKGRIVVSPHFSYGDNFRPQSQFSTVEWGFFEKKFPADFELLKAAKRIGNTMQDAVPIYFDGSVDSLTPEISSGAFADLMAHHYDPFSMMAEALKQEYISGNLPIDVDTGHFERVTGPCQFCENAAWKFPGGCAYESADQRPYPPGFLQGIVKKILDEARARLAANSALEGTNQTV